MIEGEETKIVTIPGQEVIVIRLEIIIVHEIPLIDHIDTDQVTGAVLTPDRRPAPKEDLSSVLVEKQETSSKLETPTKQPDKKQPSKNIETVSITLSQFDGDEEQFMSALGFPTSFGTTKGKKVEGNITGYMQRQHRKFKAHDYDRFAMEKKLQGKN